MSESKPSGDRTPTYDFAETLKCGSGADRILSPDDKDFLRELRISAWSVRWVLSVRSDAKLKRLRIERTLTAEAWPARGKSYVVYRRQMLQLLRWPKTEFDQLAIELPCLMGFRAQEVCTWRAEHIDFVNAETKVLDAKKHRLLTVPLNAMTAKHAEKVLNGRCEGYVLQSRSTAWQRPDRPLSTVAVWYIWQKWIRAAGLPNASEISPVVGRRFFAAEWYYGQDLSLETLRRILRHIDFETTMRYVRGLVFFEDVKRDYDRFQLGLMEKEVIAEGPGA